MSESYDKIEKYLQGELGPEEQARFEQQMRQDPDLNMEVLLFRQVKDSLTHQLQTQSEKQAFKKRLSGIESGYFQGTDEGVKNRRLLVPRTFWIKLAVASAVLLILLWRPWQPSLYDQFFEPPQAALTVMSGSEEVNLAEMQTTYNEKRYKEALPLIQTYLNQYPEDTEVTLLKGICQLEMGLFDDAQSTFEAIYSGRSIFRHNAGWFLALTYLKQGDREKCIQYLDLILEDPTIGSYNEDAQKLLRKLK